MNNKDILSNAPHGATHIDDLNEYWELTDSPKNPSMAWIESEGWRPMSDVNGYFFRSLDDIKLIESLIAQRDSQVNNFVDWCKKNKAVDGKSALFVHALKVAYDKDCLK